jgi:hypothetical protein
MREEYYPECMSVSRRVFLGAVPAALAAQSAAPGGIDRRAVVSRHNPTLHRIDPRSPLSVGNGEFAFTVDPTGLQTFPQPYEAHVPLCTQSQWGWHTAPNPTGKRPADLRLAEFDTFGRKVGYATSSDGQKPLFDWLRENPHRLHLGRIGFAIDKPEDVYLAHENCPQTFTERSRDHPSMLGALGVLPGRKVDREIMRRTLRKVFAEWRWADTWGWDFPMVAMAAASLNEPALAIDALAMDTPKNTWLPNGHNWQRANLPLYLPGNGGLLLAIAHMVRENAFPKDWNVRHEGFPPAGRK